MYGQRLVGSALAATQHIESCHKLNAFIALNFLCNKQLLPFCVPLISSVGACMRAINSALNSDRYCTRFTTYYNSCPMKIPINGCFIAELTYKINKSIGGMEILRVHRHALRFPINLFTKTGYDLKQLACF